jgi:sarcosine oxidase
LSDTYDVAIAGLGVIGGAAAAELARRGLRVIGFDRFEPPHAFGSSHGQTRIIREAYFEHPVYVPLVQRAYELWRGLERATGRTLLTETGGLMIGRPDSVLVAGARRSAERHRLQHALLDAAQVRTRFPALNPDDDMIAVLEPRAGVLFVEDCLQAQLAQAVEHGAQLFMAEPVLRWSDNGDRVRIVTARRDIQARQLILAAGAWAGGLLGELTSPFSIERQVLHWFVPPRAAAEFAPARLPIHLWQFDGSRFFYGFPDMGAGVKAGFHHDGEITQADAVRRAVDRTEVDGIRTVVRRFLPAADGDPRESSICLYTNTPDEHFLLDRHPLARHVLIASPCSGHGFKFAPVVGEILVDLIEGNASRFDLTLFRWRWN